MDIRPRCYRGTCWCCPFSIYLALKHYTGLLLLVCNGMGFCIILGDLNHPKKDLAALPWHIKNSFCIKSLRCYQSVKRLFDLFEHTRSLWSGVFPSQWLLKFLGFQVKSVTKKLHQKPLCICFGHQQTSVAAWKTPRYPACLQTLTNYFPSDTWRCLSSR